MTLTYDEVQEELKELREVADDYRSHYWCAYEAQYLHLSSSTEDMGRRDTYDWDETAYVEMIEDLLHDHLPEIYDDWFKGEEYVYSTKGKWKEDSSGYQWMLWAVETEPWAFNTRLAFYADQNGLATPEWYSLSNPDSQSL